LKERLQKDAIHERTEKERYLLYGNLIVRTRVLARKVTRTRGLGAAHFALGPDHVGIRINLVQITPLERSAYLLSDAREAFADLKMRRIG
jgi:hypothetical protein